MLTPTPFRRQQHRQTSDSTRSRSRIPAHSPIDFDSLASCYISPSLPPIQAKHMQARNGPTPPLPSAPEINDASSLVGMQTDSRYPIFVNKSKTSGSSMHSGHNSSISRPSSSYSHDASSRHSCTSTRSSKKQSRTSIMNDPGLFYGTPSSHVLTVASTSSSCSRYSTSSQQGTRHTNTDTLASSNEDVGQNISSISPRREPQYSLSRNRSRRTRAAEPTRLEMVQNANGRWEWTGPVSDPDPSPPDNLPPTTSRLSLTIRRSRPPQEEESYDEANAYSYLYGTSNGSYDARGAPNYPNIQEKSSQCSTDDSYSLPSPRRRGPRYAEESFLRLRPDPRIVMKEKMDREDDLRRAKGKKPKMTYEKLCSEKLQTDYEHEMKKAKTYWQPNNKVQPWQEMYQMGATIYDVRDPATFFLERESSDENGGKRKKSFLRRFCSKKKKPKHAGISAMNAEDLYDFTGGRLEYLTEYAVKRCVVENDL